MEINIREYSEGLPVEIKQAGFVLEDKRWVVVAFNEAGYNLTKVDLFDILNWVKNNKPEFLK